MNKFRQWYLKNSHEITWFLVGLLTATGLDSLARQDYWNAGLSFALAYVNYYFNKR